MAQAKSTKATKKESKSETLKEKLDRKPTGTSSFVLPAITVTLIAHVWVLGVVWLLTERPFVPGNAETQYVPIDMAMIEELTEPETPESQQAADQSGPLRDLLANENSQRTSEMVNYRGMSQEQISQDVYNNLKNMEAEEFQKLQSSRPAPSAGNPDPASTTKSTTQRNTEHDWYGKPSDKSYEGRVSASFNMKGREPIYSPKPTYRCKSQGTVVIKISVGLTGEVTDAAIDESKSVIDECLRTESEKYARKWKFDAAKDGQKKQDGTISFTFSAQ
jgi:TonB family protein